MPIARHVLGLVVLAGLVTSACNAEGRWFFVADHPVDLVIPGAEVKNVQDVWAGQLAVDVEVKVKNKGTWFLGDPFRVGVLARNPRTSPDPTRPPAEDELVVGLWSGPPFVNVPGLPFHLVSGIPVDVPINPRQTILLKRRLYFENPWPGERIELVFIADWNREVPEKNEDNNTRIIPF